MTYAPLIPAWIDGELRPVDKLDVHRRGLRHPAVSIFVMSRGRTLLQQRAATKYHSPDLWANACCTHPQWDEDPQVCAQRRLREELGLEDVRPTRRGTVEYRAAVGTGMTEHEVVTLFAVDLPEGAALRPDPAEVAAVRWVALPDLRAEIAAWPGLFTPWLRIYVDRHADLIRPPDSPAAASAEDAGGDGDGRKDAVLRPGVASRAGRC